MQRPRDRRVSNSAWWWDNEEASVEGAGHPREEWRRMVSEDELGPGGTEELVLFY